MCISSRYGLRLKENRSLERILHARCEARRLALEEYLEWVVSPHGGAELDQLVGELTIPETYFFRGRAHFEALCGHLVPQWRAEAGGARRPIRVWSAGCCTGEEPASLAMCLAECAEAAPFEIFATDVNARYLERARSRHYRAWKLRECPEAMRRRYFTAVAAQEFELDAKLFGRIRFARHNLAYDPLPDPSQGLAEFDAVFCRNVLMYFGAQAQQEALRRIVASIRPGGCLFLGEAEWGIAETFGLRNARELGYAVFRIGETSQALPAPPVEVPALPKNVLPEPKARPRKRRGVVGRKTGAARRGPIERAPAEGTSSFAEGEMQDAAQLIDPGKPGMARHMLEARLVREPECIPTMLELARLHADTREFDAASVWLNRAQQRDPYDASIYLMQANLALACDDPASATDALRRVLYLEPNHLHGLFLLATVLEGAGETKGVARLCRRLLHELGARPDDEVVLAEGSVTAGFLREWASRRLGI